MAGVAIDIRLEGIDEVADRLSGLDAIGRADFADVIGQLIENQTKARIADEKAAPDGTPWPAWSERYDATRDHARHSLLVGEGDLLDSIQNYSRAEEVRVGTNLVYGAIHQFGDEEFTGTAGIPPRPYLGLSDANRREIRELVLGTIEEAIE